jgi:hypothetical protein
MISRFFRPVKDDLGLKTPEGHIIFCECGKVYNGQSSRSFETRLKEHRRHTSLAQPDKSAVAEHIITHNHVIQLRDIEILSIKSGYLDSLIMEAMKLELKSNIIKKRWTAAKQRKEASHTVFKKEMSTSCKCVNSNPYQDLLFLGISCHFNFVFLSFLLTVLILI